MAVLVILKQKADSFELCHARREPFFITKNGYGSPPAAPKRSCMPVCWTLYWQPAEDVNGILFLCFPILELSAALSCIHMTVKRSLNELEAAGLIAGVHQDLGNPTKSISSFSKRRAAMNEKLEKLNQENPATFIRMNEV